VRYDKQVLGARVHWLPMNVQNEVVRAIFKEYGKILSVTDEVTN